MKKRYSHSIRLIYILIFLSFFGCEREYFTVERMANAVWSADDSQIFKIISTYETTDPNEVYFNATQGRNWQYRFETCDPDMSNNQIVGSASDFDMGGVLAYLPVYWLPAESKMLTLNEFNRAVLKDLNGTDQFLEIPAAIASQIFVNTDSWYDVRDLAPSPLGDVIAAYCMSSYYITSIFDMYYHQCIAFFDVQSGNHLFTQEIPFTTIQPALDVGTEYVGKRSHFLWSQDGTGVYMVTRDKSYMISYGENQGIEEIDLVPEKGIVTNSGTISNTGLLLYIEINENKTALQVIQLDNWKAFNSLELIPKETNTYSFW